MNEDHRARPAENRAGAAGPRGGVWVTRLILGGAVILIGLAGQGMWKRCSEHQRLNSARQTGVMLFDTFAPKAESQLASLNQQIEALANEVIQARLATNSAAIPLSRCRDTQRRAQLQSDQAEQILQRLAAFPGQAPQQFELSAPVELLSVEQQEKLADLQSELERARQNLRAVASEIDLVKERQFQLVAMEEAAGRRAQAEAESARRAEIETLQRMQAEAAQSYQAEAAQAPPVDTALRTQFSMTPPAAKTTRHAPVVSAPRPLVYAAPALSYGNAPLVIGSSYPDRFLGYRDWCRSRYPMTGYHCGYFGRIIYCW